MVTDMRAKLRGRPDNPDWYQGWALRHAFSEPNLNRMKDCILRGDFTLYPLLICNAGNVDMANQTLTHVIKKHVVNGSSHMRQKGTSVEIPVTTTRTNATTFGMNFGCIFAQSYIEITLAAKKQAVANKHILLINLPCFVYSIPLTLASLAVIA